MFQSIVTSPPTAATVKSSIAFTGPGISAPGARPSRLGASTMNPTTAPEDSSTLLPPTKRARGHGDTPAAVVRTATGVVSLPAGGLRPDAGIDTPPCDHPDRLTPLPTTLRCSRFLLGIMQDDRFTRCHSRRLRSRTGYHLRNSCQGVDRPHGGRSRSGIRVRQDNG